MTPDHSTAPATAGAPPLYETRALEVALGGQRVLGPLDLRVEHGTFLGIAGPNGSGKTTLLRALTGGVKPTGGEILLEGRPVAQYPAIELARHVGVVPQRFTLDFSFTVEEMVAMGRYARGGGAADVEAVTSALEATGMTPLAGRLVTELSGGERQRALIAQALAQETPTLLLDEPLNNLDLNHQLEIMQLLGRLHGEGRTVVVVLHDLNMAAQYCEDLLLLDQGHCAERGSPSNLLDPKIILEVFKVRVAVHRQGSRPYLTPLWSRTPECLPPAGDKHVHVVAGGGAASPLLEELVLRGFAPTVGIVSVFDTDYATAQRYELEVVSSPPFEPFPQEAIEEFDGLAHSADVIVVAPVFFGKGNLAPLRTALQVAQGGKRVVVFTDPPIQERDLCDGEAAELVRRLISAGALEARDTADAVTKIQGASA
ncbi:MAG: ATP-binding cassette domain-containing protein [Thermoleophilia bacterium]|nr:ATP-binding cassette domain-containing protein [Thermoleophilia bacterium]